MKLVKIFLLFFLVLPLTLLMDLVLFALTRSCPSCGSFTQWIQTEGALSFPLVVQFTGWVEQFFAEIRNSRKAI